MSRRAWHAHEAFGGQAKYCVLKSGHNKRLELFYVGNDNRLFHNWQLKAGGNWNGQAVLGGEAHNYYNTFVVDTNQDGRHEIFWIGNDHVLYHNWQNTAPDSANWNGPIKFKDNRAIQICVGMNSDGRLELFYIGFNQHIFHMWQLNKSQSAEYHVQEELDGSETGELKVSTNSGGGLELFYRMKHGGFIHNRQLAAGDSTKWTGPMPLGFNSDWFIVAKNPNRRFALFYTKSNKILHNWQNPIGADSEWYGEVELSELYANTGNSLKCVTRRNGRLELFYMSNDGGVRHTWQRTPGESQGWDRTFERDCERVMDYQVLMDSTDVLHLFYYDTQRRLFHKSQELSGGGAWQSEVQIGEGAYSIDGVGENYDGRIDVFYRDVGNNIIHTWQV